MGDSTSTSSNTNYYHGEKWSTNCSMYSGIGICAKCGARINIASGKYNSAGYYLCDACYRYYR